VVEETMKLRGLLIGTVVLLALAAGVYFSNKQKAAEASKPPSDAPPKILALPDGDVTKIEWSKLPAHPGAARYRIAASENPELIANVLPESVLGALYRERAEQRARLAEMEAKYGAAYPLVIQLKAELDDINESVRQEIVRTGERVRAEYRAALRSEQMLGESLDR
jgi:hypothetical protein